MLISKLGIPENFEEKLPDLKSKTLKWSNTLYSGTPTNSNSTISFYHSLNDNTVGNLILVPGLASNSKIDPLLKAIQYWGLTHRYNVVSIDTFLGDFEKEPTIEQVQKNTYGELQIVLKESINFIMPYIANSKTCLIGHCVSATLITDTMNNFIKQENALPVQSIMLFAPFPKIPQSKYDAIMSRRMQIETDFADLTNLDPVTKLKLQHMKYVCAMQKFVQSVEDSKFEPKIMAKWGIPVTFIVAGRDKISPASRAKERYDLLTQEQGTADFNYIYLPERRHCFEKLYTDYNDIIQIIKSQHKRKNVK